MQILRFSEYPGRAFVLLLAAVLALSTTASAEVKLGSEFYPTQSSLGRDGLFYTYLYNEHGLRAGGIVAIHPAGRLRAVSRFPYVMETPKFVRWGTVPAGRVGIGQDGVIYGATREGGAFSSGIVYKLETSGARSPLFHLRSYNYTRHVLPARNGNLYLAQGASTDQILRLSPDGSSKTVVLGNDWPMEMIETPQGEIIVSIYRHRPFQNSDARLFKFDANDQMQPFALLDTTSNSNTAAWGHSLIVREDGTLFCVTDTKLFQVAPDGAVTVLHEFALPFGGQDPGQIFLAKDGSLIGCTSRGGLQNAGTIFRLVPATGEYTVLEHLPPLGFNGFGPVWLDRVLPFLAEATAGNRPPCARNDVIATSELRRSTRIEVLKNDRDADGDSLAIVSVGEAQHGTVAFDFVKQQIDYTPDSADPVYDTFSYKIVDGSGGSAVGNVYLRPNRAGRYRGEMTSVASTESGDPGTPVGTLAVRVNAAGVLAGQLEMLDRKYTFTGRFNERNIFGTPLRVDARGNNFTSIQLRLKPVGSSWEVEALAVKNYISFVGTCVVSE